MRDDAGHLGGTRPGVLLASGTITLVYVLFSAGMHAAMVSLRLRRHQFRRIMHRRERLSSLAFLAMLLVAQATSINLSAYVSNEFVARRVSDAALFSWILLCGLALMTVFVAFLSRTYSRIHLYLGLVLTTCGTLVLVADAVASGKVSVLDPLAGAACLVGLWATFYAVPIAFHMTMMMTGGGDRTKVPYHLARSLGHVSSSSSARPMTTDDGVLLSEDGGLDDDDAAVAYDKNDTEATMMDDVRFNADGDV